MDFTQHVTNNNTLTLTADILYNSPILYVPNTIELVNFLSNNQQITKLSLNACFSMMQVDPILGMTPISILTNAISKNELTHLTELDLTNNYIPKVDSFINGLGYGLPHLTTLKLSNIELDNDHLNMLYDKEGFIKLMKRLTSLDLSHNHISSDGIKYLLSIIPAPLDTDDLTIEQQTNCQALYNHINHFLTLEELNLSYNNINNKAIHKLAKKISSFENLHILNLEGNPMGISGFAELAHAIKITNHQPIDMYFGDHKTITQEKIDEINVMLNDNNYSQESFNVFLDNLHANEYQSELCMSSANRYNVVSNDIAELSNTPDFLNNPLASKIMDTLKEIQSIHLLSALNPSMTDNQTSQFTPTLLGESQHNLTDYDSSSDDDSCVIS